MNKSVQILDLIESLDSEIYSEIISQLNSIKSSGKYQDWNPMVLTFNGIKKNVEVFDRAKGNLMFRIVRKVYPYDSKFVVEYNLYKFSNKKVLKEPVLTKTIVDSKEELDQLLLPYKK